MFRTVMWTLRRRRYAAMAALLFLVAVGCVAAGTWQIARFQQSVHDNNALRANAHAAPVPLSEHLVPIAGTDTAPQANAIQFRTVTAAGSYLPGAQQFLPTRSGQDTYDVVIPFRTDTGVLLVVRGTVAARPNGQPPTVAAPPPGRVHITGRLEPASAAGSGPGPTPGAVITSISPSAQSARLGVPVFQAFATLNPGTTGTAGVHPVPAPDLSNPAGGAYEWQHFAYIIQWYVFALLALIAPFAIARHEVREARRRFLGTDEDEIDAGEFDGAELDEAAARPALSGSRSSGGELERRAAGTLARTGDPDPERLQRAVRLADRYGRAISMADDARSSGLGARPRRAAASGRWLRGIGEAQSAARSAASPHRSDDAYHGWYNDYLWQLALADGAIPSGTEPAADGSPRELGAPSAPDPAPRVIDATDEPGEEPRNDNPDQN